MPSMLQPVIAEKDDLMVQFYTHQKEEFQQYQKTQTQNLEKFLT